MRAGGSAIDGLYVVGDCSGNYCQQLSQSDERRRRWPPHHLRLSRGQECRKGHLRLSKTKYNGAAAFLSLAAAPY